MKKALIIAAFTTLFTLPAVADDQPGLKTGDAPPPPHKIDSGYRGAETHKTMSIKEAKEMHDGASVSFQGNLIQKKGNDMYVFRDKTDQIDVMIPMAVFEDRQVEPDQLITINGTLDKKQQPPVARIDRLIKE